MQPGRRCVPRAILAISVSCHLLAHACLESCAMVAVLAEASTSTQVPEPTVQRTWHTGHSTGVHGRTRLGLSGQHVHHQIASASEPSAEQGPVRSCRPASAQVSRARRCLEELVGNAGGASRTWSSVSREMKPSHVHFPQHCRPEKHRMVPAVVLVQE